MYAADGILGSVTRPATAVQLLLHVQDSAESACSVRTGYVFFGTLVYWVKLPWNSCQNVCYSNGLYDKAYNWCSTADKKSVVIFRDFAADRGFGTYHVLILGVKLP